MSGTTGEKFICDVCEHKQIPFDDDNNHDDSDDNDNDDKHIRLHPVVRVSENIEEKELTLEARLKLLEDKLGNMSQLLSRFVERGIEGSPNDPLTKGDLQAAVVETESAQPVPEEAPGATENT